MLVWGARVISAGGPPQWMPPGYLGTSAPTNGPLHFPAPRAGSVFNLRMSVRVPGVPGGQLRYQLTVNGIAPLAGPAFTVSSNAATAADLVRSAAIAPGDLIGLECVHIVNGGSSPQDVFLSAEFGP